MLDSYWINSYFPMFANSTKKLHKFENNLEWQNVFIKWCNVCLDLFEWTGLPDTVSERYIEEALLIEGKIALVKDDELGYLMLRVNPNYIFNIYGQFSKLNVYGNNGYNKQFDCYMEGADNSQAKSVLCRDNNLMYPYMMYLISWTNRLSQAMRSIDVASLQLKHPYIIKCSEQQKLSIEQLFKDTWSNKPLILTTNSLTTNEVEVLQTGANPTILQQMWDNYYKLENTLKTLIGIKNNSMPNKSERLLVDEVNSDKDEQLINIFIRLYQRQLFCKQANELFGLNINCKLRFEELMNTNETDTNNLQNVETNSQPLE